MAYNTPGGAFDVTGSMVYSWYNRMHEAGRWYIKLLILSSLITHNVFQEK